MFEFKRKSDTPLMAKAGERRSRRGTAWRVIGLMAIASLMLYVSTYHLPEPTLGPILTSSSILLYIVAFSHITRRIVIPHLDLRHFLVEALKGNTAAAIVVASVLYVFVQLVQSGIALLR